MPNRASGPVMVVDDDFFVRDLITNIVRNMGADSLEAPDGKTAALFIARFRPSLVICDVQMPVLDGISLCRLLRRQGNRTPFYLLTNSIHPAQSCRASVSGITGWIAKPENPEKLAIRIGSIVRRHAVPSLAPAPLSS